MSFSTNLLLTPHKSYNEDGRVCIKTIVDTEQLASVSKIGFHLTPLVQTLTMLRTQVHQSEHPVLPVSDPSLGTPENGQEMHINTALWSSISRKK